MAFSIAGKTAIVTGAGTGIGLAIARHFIDAGANVMCVSTDEAALEKNFARDDDTPNVRAFAGDLRERLTIANLISATIDAFDQIDILVNASREFATTDPLDAEDDSLSRLIDRNMMTAYRLIQACARRMMKQAEDREPGEPAGAVVNLSSTSAQGSRPDLLGYSISAAAVNQMTRSMALALAEHNIRVNAVALGSVMSASMQAALKDNRAWREEIEHLTPIGRVASAGELTDVVQFLASDAAGFITGEVITVDGGRSLLDPISVPAH